MISGANTWMMRILGLVFDITCDSFRMLRELVEKKEGWDVWGFMSPFMGRTRIADI